jgi:hypothetical protein
MLRAIRDPSLDPDTLGQVVADLLAEHPLLQVHDHLLQVVLDPGENVDTLWSVLEVASNLSMGTEGIFAALLVHPASTRRLQLQVLVYSLNIVIEQGLRDPDFLGPVKDMDLDEMFQIWRLLVGGMDSQAQAATAHLVGIPDHYVAMAVLAE